MEYNDQMKNRVKRMEGQLRGILKMMEENKDCKEVITQLSAVRSAVDRTIGVIVSSNLVECVQDAGVNGEKTDEMIKEAVNLLVKSRWNSRVDIFFSFVMIPIGVIVKRKGGIKMNADKVLDAKGLACPMPIVKSRMAINELEGGKY